MIKIMCEFQNHRFVVLLLEIVSVSYGVIYNVTEHDNETDVSVAAMNFISEEPKFVSQSSSKSLDELEQAVNKKYPKKDLNPSKSLINWAVSNRPHGIKEVRKSDEQQATAMRNSENQDSKKSDENESPTFISDSSANSSSPKIRKKGLQSSSEENSISSNEILRNTVETEWKNDEEFNSFTPSMKGFSSILSNLLHCAKQVMEHGNCVNHKLTRNPATSHRHIRATGLEYGDHDSMSFDDTDGEASKFLTLISPEALANILGFFEDLKENIALFEKPNVKGHKKDTINGENDSTDEITVDQDPEDKLLKTNYNSKQLETSWSSKESHLAVRRFNDYPTKSKFVGSHNEFLQRANNYNPFWLYTRLGLGKRSN